jgi:hypothetical protein
MYRNVLLDVVHKKIEIKLPAKLEINSKLRHKSHFLPGGLGNV